MESNTTLKNVLRWIAVLPASIAGSFAVYALSLLNGGMVKSYQGTVGQTISLTDILIFAVSNGLCGYAFVWIGTYVAPSYNRYVSIVITVLLTLVCGVSATLEVITHGFTQTLVGCLLTIIGATVACVQLINKETSEEI